jgi:transcriptional regulator with XRE-family HTH domain
MNGENFAFRLSKAADLIGGQAELSRKTKISKVSISAYVTGKSEPSRDRLVAMAEAAGVSVAWLAAGIGPMQQGESVEAEPQQKTAPEEDINIQQLLNMTAKVLLSDTIYRPALAANIKAFSRSIDIELDNKELRSRMERMEERMAAMERRLDTKKAANDS